MSKEFVPYELAVKLKELGFDEPCFGYYDNAGKLYYNTNGQPVEKDWVWVDNQILPTDMILVPTFSQAFRWFRENHDLNYVIVKAESWFYTINGCNTQEGFNTYEEAELACLTKLIEIVEQQKQK
jgi:hypothetical protein